MTEASVSTTAAGGSTRMGLRAVEHIIHAALRAVPGATEVDAKLAGLGGRAFPRLMVQLDPDAQVAAVDAAIAVVWPSPVTDVAAAARAAIIEALETFTGYSTTRVNVVVGHATPGPRVTARQVATRPHPQAVVPAAPSPAAVRQPHTQAGVTVRAVAIPAAPSVRVPETPDARSARVPAAPAPTPVRSVAVPDAPAADRTRSVTAPPALETWAPPTPPELPLRPVHTPVPMRARKVSAPQPPQPRHVSAPAPVKAWHPQVKPLPVVRVGVPDPQPLRQITIFPFKPQEGR